MNTSITPKTEQLAAQYATLKHQSKLIQQQLDKIEIDLKKQLTIGQAIVTPEFRLAYEPGKSYFSWTCPDEVKKKLQNALIEKGVADIKIGKEALVLRFLKQADDE